MAPKNITGQYPIDVQEGVLNQTRYILRMMDHTAVKYHGRFHSVAQSQWEEAMMGMSSLLHSRKCCIGQRDQGLFAEMSRQGDN